MESKQSAEPKRWAFIQMDNADEARIERHPEGPLVDYSDWQALAAALKDMEQEMATLKFNFKQCAKHTDVLQTQLTKAEAALKEAENHLEQSRHAVELVNDQLATAKEREAKLVGGIRAVHDFYLKRERKLYADEEVTSQNYRGSMAELMHDFRTSLNAILSAPPSVRQPVEIPKSDLNPHPGKFSTVDDLPGSF